MDTFEKEKEQAEFERDRRKWKIRRRLALASFGFLMLISIIFLAGAYLVDIEQAKAASEFNGIFIALIGFFSSIVIAYVGAVTYSEKTINGSITKYK